MLISSHISMVNPLYSDSPMEMDLLGGEDKKVVDKEKMVMEGFKATDIVVRMETNGSGLVLGKR